MQDQHAYCYDCGTELVIHDENLFKCPECDKFVELDAADWRLEPHRRNYKLFVIKTYTDKSLTCSLIPTLLVSADKHDLGPEWCVTLGFLFWAVELQVTHE